MNYFKVILASFLSAIIALALYSTFLDNRLQEPVPVPTPTTVTPDFWQKIVSDQNLSTVAVQSFKGGKIIREGSGIIISSDGIIVTTFDIVSGSDILQIFHKDKILRAKLVKYSSFKNLAILKIESANLDVARLDTNYQFQSGQEVVISGKIIKLSSPAAFAQKGMVSYVFSKDILLDTESRYFLSGSKTTNTSGFIVGMAYLREGSVRLITAEAIDNFVKEYFASL